RSIWKRVEATLICRIMMIKDLLKSPKSKEVLAWLQGGAPDARTLGELPTTEPPLALANELYSFGATQATAVEIDPYISDRENTGRLVISLPESQIARAKLFAWNAEHARELGFDPDEDTGQRHLLVMLD